MSSPYETTAEYLEQGHYPHPKASAQHRLGGWALDYALYSVTFGIGWMIWSLVTWGDGQTPAKKILKMRVYNKATSTPAKWGQMAIRQFLMPLSVFFSFILLTPIRLAFNSVPGNFSVIAGFLVSLIALAVPVLFITDAFWILRKGELNRLVDKVVKTDVLNESN
jgi:hypothetical protein